MSDEYDPVNHRLAIVELDPWLTPYTSDLTLRINRLKRFRKDLLVRQSQLMDFANGHHYFGFHQTDGGWVYREWAPAAEALYLLGDFNDWNRHSHPLNKCDDGVWEIELAGQETLWHQSRVKVHVISQGSQRDRIPLYIRRTIQDPETHDFSGQVWNPPAPFRWTDKNFRVNDTEPPMIYECHIGMAQEKEAIGTYVEFEEKILPRIKALGYNTIQIMAIMEHPYYASFGYHVSNYFAPSSWFGTPEELKSLINRAHEMEITVLMDLVHSHAVKNIAEGINQFDGSTEQFFHPGKRGTHQAWDSKLFNYGKHEVVHFLLSSIKYWLEEFHFDGFRFDGVTSMIYHDHGLGTAFDDYDKYFSLNTDLEAITYLQLANQLIKEIRPDALVIAEDMSGMPGMCLPVEAGGIGFDYRLAMGMPDFWVKTLERIDDDWGMESLFHELSTCRPGEKQIAYVESHDQALVGDKTMIFRMADQEMYRFMDKGSRNLGVERAVSLHKMARLITLSLGSEGYLNFMGNEFGHPEWIDFPREGNGWSFAHCRRLWSLADNPFLYYNDLLQFDRAMIHLMTKKKLMGREQLQILSIDEVRKIIAFRKINHLFIFNFHPTQSYDELEIPLHGYDSWHVVMDTDEHRFGGQGRISHAVTHEPYCLKGYPGDGGIAVYAPSRTGMVLKSINDVSCQDR